MSLPAVAILLLLATVLNYLDRLSLSILAPMVLKEFRLNSIDYGHITSAFLAAYAVMYALSGPIVDRLGAKRGLAIFVAVWSLAQTLHAFAVNKLTLGGARFLLGLAEPANWPAATKAIAESFPSHRRAFAMGVFNSGSSLGGLIAAPVILAITAATTWRTAFLFTGLAGFVWVAVWWFAYKAPLPAPPTPIKWRELFRNPLFGTLFFARFLTDPVPYFVMFWLPQYLFKERGMSQFGSAEALLFPFLFSDLAYLAGGWFSDKLRNRRALMILGAALMPSAALVPFVSTPAAAIAAICVMAIGHSIWSTNLQTLVADRFSPPIVGTAAGCIGSGGALGGTLATLAAGYVVQSFGYTPVFLACAVLHPLACAVFIHGTNAQRV
jgi:MFS transporter, ACS family, hexuronate transporter